MPPSGGKDIENSLNSLSISTVTSRSSQKHVVDSWEDDDNDDDDLTSYSDLLPGSANPIHRPLAPPPTPNSPVPSSIGGHQYERSASFADEYQHTWKDRPTGPTRNDLRPEKTDAVAKRLIAGALGVKAPKRTEEQKAYDRAVREKELKRRDAEKAAAVKAVEDAEKARAAVWED